VRFDEIRLGELGPELIVVPSVFMYTFPEGATIITGEVGDQIVGSEKSLNYL